MHPVYEGTPIKPFVFAILILSALGCGQRSASKKHRIVARRGVVPVEDPLKRQRSMPHVHLITDTVTRPDKKALGSMHLFATEDNEVFEDFRIKAKYRGSTSLTYPKKQFSVDTVEDDGEEDIDIAPLGLPEESDWILHAPWEDRSFVRNAFVYQLSRDMGNYAPRSRYVTLSHTEGDHSHGYSGIYMLMEKIKISPSRLDIPKKGMDGDREVPAYLLKFDRSDSDTYDYRDEVADRTIVVSYPKLKKLKPSQMTYIQDKTTQLAELIAERSPDVFSLLDLDSTVDMVIIQEIGKNIDAYRLSTYFYKPPGDKFYFGPAWDFNLAFATRGTQRNDDKSSEEFMIDANGWFNNIWHIPAFQTALKKRWQEIREQILRADRNDEMIQGFVEQFAGEIVNNNLYWSEKLKIPSTRDAASAEFEKEMEFFRSYLDERIAYLDEQLDRD